MTYEEFLNLSGLTEAQAWELAQLDNMANEPNITGTDIRESDHGLGLFATSEFAEGTTIGDALIDGKRTNLGRYVNHSSVPNTYIVVNKLGSFISVHTLKDIQVGEEVTVCYGDNYIKQRPLFEYSPMEKMEIHLRSLPNAIVGYGDVKTDFFPNSGLAVRTLRMKAGEVVIGKIHKEWNVNTLVSGSLHITNNPDGKLVRVDAPQVFETGPGSQKLVMCITDCVFMNTIVSHNETEEELLNRMTEESRVTKQIEKGLLCQYQ